MARFNRHYNEGKSINKDPLAEFNRSLAAGNDVFRASIKSKARPVNNREIRAELWSENPALEPDHISEAMARVLGISFEQIRRPKRSNHFRPMGVYLTKKHCPLELKAVGAYWKMDYAAASIAAKRFEKKIADDPKIAAAVNQIETLLEKI